MNQEKIGSLIKKIRKENNLTQQDFAKKYGVTYQAVSKWENGKNIPDISLLKQICDDFNIDIKSLLTGDYTTNENKASLKKDKINLLKKKNFLFLCLFVLLIGIIMAIIILKNRSNDFEFKTISSDCSNFTITGSVAYNDIKSAIYIASINYCGGADDNLYKSIECILYEKNGTLENRISQIVIKEENPKKLEDLLKNVTFNIDNYIYKCKEFQNNGLYVTIKATDSNNKQVTYSVPLTMNNVCTDK